MSLPVRRRICLICGSSTHYSHFGIDSCRACAEFYKRTVTANKTYTCRQGTLDCNLDKNERYTCRRCRFDKCRELGMTLDDPRRRNRRLGLPVNAEDVGRPSSVELPSLSPRDSILERISREHIESLTRRKREELILRPTALRLHVRVPHESEEVLLCSWSFLMECLRMFAGDYFSLAGTCFPEFETLTLEEKFLLLQSCAVRIFLHEALFRTAEVFGKVLPVQRFMITSTTCLDRENITFLIQDSTPSVRHRDIVKAFEYYAEKVVQILWPAIEKVDLTRTEISALFGLVVWQFDPRQQLPESLIQTSEKIRQEIFTDLRRYYHEDLKLNDFSVRLGSLMTMEHTIQEASSMMGEEIQTFNLLDMLGADASFLQVVLQIKL